MGDVSALAVIGAGVGAMALIAAVGILLDRPRQTDDRLLGTWQSDADRTIADLRSHRSVGADEEKSLRQLFGRMTITFTPLAYIIDLDDQSTTGRYRVVTRDEESVVIRSRDVLSGRQAPRRLHFVDADTYWVYIDLVEMREYFRRLS